MHQFVLSLLVVATCSTAQSDNLSKASVVKLANQVSKAFFTGDYATIIDSTYPKAVEALGGREKAIKVTESAMKKLKELGYIITKYEIGEPGDFHVEGDNTFVVLPTTMEIKSPNGKIRTQAYQLAISPDSGKSWTFIDGSGLKNEKSRDKVLPKMPAKLKLPELGVPEIITQEE